MSALARLVADLILGVVTAVLWLPLLSELLCFVRRKASHRPPTIPSRAPRLLFLVPAHNEELLITACVRSLLDVDYSAVDRRVIVVADNCTDATARLAREAGAECLERSDLVQPGKPRALAWALGQLELDSWDAIVVVDADSTVERGFARAVAAFAPLNDIVIQANFLVLNEWESWLTRLGGVLSRCRYEVTYPLKQRAGINCPMTGNGMVIGLGRPLRDGWKAFSITEDSELYATYTAAGIPIKHAANANLFSQEAVSLNQGTTQRRRWLAGRLWVIRQYGAAILTSQAIGWHQKLDVLVELGLSSPVLHLSAAVAIALLSVVIGGPAAPWIAAGALASLAGIAITTAVVIAHHPRPWATLAAFALLPWYALWRVLVLVRTLFTLRDTRWRRTRRTAHVA
jgi:cellulose synthase/poly-beta-1,6-N-acetylglucosamine synthase-like glycosyltransferase